MRRRPRDPDVLPAVDVDCGLELTLEVSSESISTMRKDRPLLLSEFSLNFYIELTDHDGRLDGSERAELMRLVVRHSKSLD